MFEKECRCGKSKKSFMMDIGPFYIDECCQKAGYDHNGELIGKPQAPVEEPAAEAAPAAQEVEAPKEEKALKDMAPSELRKLAEAKGIKNYKRLSKKKLLEALED